MMYYGIVVTPNNGAMTGGVHRLKIENEPDPSKWEPKEMTPTEGPMTGGINVGFKNKNVWVYFGTGKFWDVSDKTDLRAHGYMASWNPNRLTAMLTTSAKFQRTSCWMSQTFMCGLME